MAVTVEASPDSKEVTISVHGRFDHTLYRAFREAYSPYTAPGLRVVLNLGATEFIDSSALGMLLQLREEVGGDTANISIRNCNPTLSKILRIANFQRLFTIENSQT